MSVSSHKKHITRFAPSPTGFLHLGHAYSALFTAQKALESGGTFHLRIEDIDTARCKPEYEDGIFEDLEWLSLTWETPVMRQSERTDAYNTAISTLKEQGLIYPCFCSRKDIENASNAPHGPEGTLYPGTCKGLSQNEIEKRIAANELYAMRLDLDKALSLITGPLHFHDHGTGKTEAEPEKLGDVVITRKEGMASYHLSVVVDDYTQGINLVTRGEDLLYATHIHRLLQELLGYDVPEYHHHRLILDENGQRLAKRHDSLAIRTLREQGKTKDDIFKLIDWPAA